MDAEDKPQEPPFKRCEQRREYPLLTHVVAPPGRRRAPPSTAGPSRAGAPRAPAKEATQSTAARRADMRPLHFSEAKPRLEYHTHRYYHRTFIAHGGHTRVHAVQMTGDG